jgi:hypothetical protein
MSERFKVRNDTEGRAGTMKRFFRRKHFRRRGLRLEGIFPDWKRWEGKRQDGWKSSPKLLNIFSIQMENETWEKWKKLSRACSSTFHAFLWARHQPQWYFICWIPKLTLGRPEQIFKATPGQRHLFDTRVQLKKHLHNEARDWLDIAGNEEELFLIYSYTEEAKAQNFSMINK